MVSKVHGAWIDGYDSRNKDKNITITKIKSLLSFLAVYYSKNHVIPHPVIAAILQQLHASQILEIQPKTIRYSY